MSEQIMYAIITDGSRQYKVEEGQELVVDYRDVPAGQKVKFDSVLAVGGDGDAKLGAPLGGRARAPRPRYSAPPKATRSSSKTSAAAKTSARRPASARYGPASRSPRLRSDFRCLDALTQ